MSIFKTETEALDFLASLGMGIYRDYDPVIDCDYWYIATGGHDGRVEYKALNHRDCIRWIESQALEGALD